MVTVTSFIAVILVSRLFSSEQWHVIDEHTEAFLFYKSDAFEPFLFYYQTSCNMGTHITKSSFDAKESIFKTPQNESVLVEVLK